MNIEQAIDILKNSIADYVIGEYCEKCADNKICDDRAEDCYYQQAIDIVVTAYEEKGEECDFLDKELYNANQEIQKLQINIQKEKEKNKELQNRVDYLSKISGLLSTDTIIGEE